jgi:hypothetical protein
VDYFCTVFASNKTLPMSIRKILADKYAKMQEKRISHGMVPVTNDQLNALHPDNPILIQVPQADIAAYEKQGYRVYTPPIAEPKEAKKKKEQADELDSKE